MRRLLDLLAEWLSTPHVRELEAACDLATKRANASNADLQSERNDHMRTQKKWAETGNELSAANATVRNLEDRLRAGDRLAAATDQLVNVLKAENVSLRDRVAVADQNFREVNQKLIDALTAAGDSMSVRATGRTLFSRQPVEPPPQEAHSQEQAAVQGRPLASDIAIQRNRAFAKRKMAENRSYFESLATQSGVRPVNVEFPEGSAAKNTGEDPVN